VWAREVLIGQKVNSFGKKYVMYRYMPAPQYEKVILTKKVLKPTAIAA
jgi:hypothetical protein